MNWKELLGRTQSALRGLRNTNACALPPDAGNTSLDLAELEDRILMSAAPMALEAMPDADVAEPIEAEGQLGAASPSDVLVENGSQLDEVADQPLSESVVMVDEVGADAELTDRHELVFVDTSVNGYQELVDHIVDSQDDATQLEVFQLNSNADGVEQISRVLEQYNQLDAVHILSHGDNGSVRLGDVWLSADHVQGYAGDIAKWSNAFSSNGDLLLYGCNLAETANGQDFLESLHVLTGADVTASTDVTGHSSLGGDWDLEFSIGCIETDQLLSPENQQEWAFVLPSENVFDGFETHNYAGNQGSEDWSSPWQEVNDDGLYNSGNVYVVHYDLDAIGAHCLEINAAANVGLYREVDLGTASSAKLSFDYQRHFVDGFIGSTLEVQVSDDGGSSWDTIHTIAGGLDATIEGVQLDVASYMAPNTKIRFTSTGDGIGSIFLDHIDVTYETNIAPVLVPGPTFHLSSIQEDAFNNTGNTVGQILASAGFDRIIDVNTDARKGIAVIGVDDTNGQWQYDALADGDWQDFGTVSDNSAVLLASISKVRFVPTADYSGSGGEIEFRAWDQTRRGVGATDVDVSVGGGDRPFSLATATADITVESVNDAPQLTLPVDQSVNEDTDLAILGVAIGDVDSSTDPLNVTLQVDHGTLTLGNTTNLLALAGDGTVANPLTFNGTVDHINAALATLSYRGEQHFVGTDTLNVTVDDLGNNGTGGALQDGGSIDIQVQPVNDAPQLTLPVDQSVNEDTDLAILGVAIGDVDSSTDPLNVTLQVDHGTLTLGNTTNLLALAGDGTVANPLTFNGTVDHINAALATLSYRGEQHFVGTDTLNVTVDDLGNNGTGGALQDGGSIDIQVQPVNDAPQLTLPVDQSVNEDTDLAILGVAIGDVDSSTDPLNVTLQVDHGTLTLGNTTNLLALAGDGTVANPLTFNGTVDHINAALATLSYRGEQHFVGTDTLNVTVDDLGNNGTGGALQDGGSIDIQVQPVNDAPQLTLPVDQSVNEDTDLAILGVAIGDVDSSTDPLNVTLQVDHGTLTLGNTTNLLALAGDGTVANPLTFNGTVDHINAALATLSYRGEQHFVGTDTLNVTVDDLGNNGTGGALQDGGSIDIQVQPVNDQPTSVGFKDVVVKEDTVFSVVDLHSTFDDVEDEDSQLTYVIQDITNPKLFEKAFIHPTNGKLVLKYVPDMYGKTDITILAEDTEGLSTAETLRVRVIPVNDVPVASRDHFAVHGDEVLQVPAAGILANDSDIEGDKLSVALVKPPEHGTLTIRKDGSFRYTPDPSFVGLDSFAYAASDGKGVSSPVPVVIRVLAPSSPVDTESTDSDNESTSDESSSSADSPRAEDPIQAIVNSELPSTISESDADSNTEGRQRRQVADDTTSVDGTSQTVSPASNLWESYSSGQTRSASRSRDGDETGTFLTTQAEFATTSDLALPAVDAATSFADLEGMNITLEEDGSMHRLMIGSAVSLTTGLTVGYVLWTVRAGYLLTSLIAQMPAWKMVDPLPILNSVSTGSRNVDGESLESIVQSDLVSNVV